MEAFSRFLILVMMLLYCTGSTVQEDYSPAATERVTVGDFFHYPNTAEQEALHDVTSYDAAEAYLTEYCPRVTLERIPGDTSYYIPPTETIQLAEQHLQSDELGFIFTHELMHHYQYHGKYKHSRSVWNAGIEDKTIEIEADRMTYHLYGEGNGGYTNIPATGAELEKIEHIIRIGNTTGCE